MLKSKIITFKRFMGIIALASVTNGTMNLPKEVKEALGIKETKGKIVFIKDTNGKIYIEKA
jgi:bifunctional DNA-binding transcriptional regulator/antitoxin component of YhaV-PrlF toxin-antitoxin module